MPFILPLDTHVFIMFLSYLFDQSLSYSTILNYAGAINYHSKSSSLPDYSDSFIVKKFMKSLRNLSPRAASLLPITHDMLESLILSVDRVIQSEYERKLVNAMYITMYVCCLRIGEVAYQVMRSTLYSYDKLGFHKVW